MGNMCGPEDEITNQQQNSRVRLRNSESDLSLKGMIQIKKYRVSEDYELKQPPIGKGTFGSVYKAINRQSKVFRAVKRIAIQQKSQKYFQQFTLLKKLDHPNIIRIFDIYVETKHIYIVMEFCEGGELFARILQKNCMSENEARIYMQQLLSAISHCHNYKIMHRDLKPQNIMFLGKKDNNLKIIDFGAGTSDTSKQNHKVGSIYYIAPEVLKKQYNEKCDVWSLGVILYIMIAGRPPFNGKTDKQITEKIFDGKVNYIQKCWGRVSFQLKDLITRMLTYDHTTRITAKQALIHPWIVNEASTGNKNIYVQNQLTAIRDFCLLNSFQSAIMTYINHNLLQTNVLASLQAKFQHIDANKDGKISFKEFRYCYVEYMPQTTQKEIQSIFGKLDKNHSGFIDYTEFLTSAMHKNTLETEQLFDKAFEMIDTNNDGALSKEQLNEAFGASCGKLYQQIIDQFDLDKDGFISKKQFKLAMMTTIKKQKTSISE